MQVPTITCTGTNTELLTKIEQLFILGLVIRSMNMEWITCTTKSILFMKVSCFYDTKPDKQKYYKEERHK